MFGWLSVVFDGIGGFFKDEARVKNLALIEARRKARESQMAMTQNDPEMNEAITNFLSRVTTRTNETPQAPAADGAVPPQPAGPPAAEPPLNG